MAPCERFRARRIVVDCGAEREYDEAEWLDAIVFVEHGEIELECTRGGRRRFRAGDILWLAGLPLRALHCCGGGHAVLLAVSRGGPMSFQPGRGLKHIDDLNRSEREPMIHEPKEAR